MKTYWPVLLICLALDVSLSSELAGTPDLNDNVLHLTLVNGMASAVEHGKNPFDFWSPEIALGEPIARLYQPGAHALVVLVYFLFFKTMPLRFVFVWINLMALFLMPLTFYFTAGLLEFPRPVRLAAALLCPLVSGDSFGIDLGSYVWAGHGLFPQLIATHGLLLAIGFGWRSIRYGLPWIIPALLVAFTGWCNLLYGYVAGVSLIMVALIPEPNGKERFRRLFKIGALSAVFMIPKAWAWFSDIGVVQAGEVGGRQYMSDSWGVRKVLQNLFTGELLDHGRWLPVLTILALTGVALVLLGIVCSIWRVELGFKPFRQYRADERFFLLGFAGWLALYFGRPFWGELLYLFGITPAMPLHRFIGPVQIFAVFLGAVVLAAIWHFARPLGFSGVALITMAIIAAPLQERMTYLRQNREWAEQTRTAFASEQSSINAALDIAQKRGGRVYAGLPSNWGASFKIGAVPFYSLFPPRRIPSVGFLYVGFLKANSSIYYFNESQPADFARMDVRTVIAPADRPQPAFLIPLGVFRRFAVYGMETGGEMQTNRDGTVTRKSAWHPKWKGCDEHGFYSTWPDAMGFIVGRKGATRFEYE